LRVACLSAPGEITNRRGFAAASGARDVGFNTSMASGPRRRADANGDRRARLRGDLQAAGKTVSVGYGGLIRAEMWRKPWVKPQVRPFSIGKTSRCRLLHSPAAKLQRNCKAGWHRAKQVVLRGRPRTPCVAQQDDVPKKRGRGLGQPPGGFFFFPGACGIGCDRFAQLARTRIRVEAYKLVHPAAPP